jgi:Fe-S cluster assembly iron-binding protein IscA
MPIKLKGSKIKKVTAGSAVSKSVKLKELKEVKEEKEKKALVIQVLDPALKGLEYELTTPDGKKEKAVISGSGKVSAVVDPSGESKLELPGLNADLKKAR